MARSLQVLLAIGMLVGPAQAQQANLEGLEFGVVWDGATSSIRRLLGFPGAAYLGPRTAEGLRGASISPKGEWLYWGETGATVLPASATPQELSVERIRQAGWCDSNTFFLQQSTASQVAWQWWRRDPLSGRFFTFAEMPALGVDAESPALPVVCRPRDAALFVAGPSGIEQLLPQSTSVRQIAAGEFQYLTLREAQLFAVEAGTAKIHRWEESEGQWQPQSWFAQAEESSKAVAAAIVERKQNSVGVLVAFQNPAAPKLRLYSMDGAEIWGEWPLDAQPTRLEPLPVAGRASRFFLLNQRLTLEDFLEIAEVGPEISVFFVPDASGNSQGGGQ